MYIERHRVTITTDENGDGVGYTPSVTGRLLCIKYTKPGSGGYDNGVNFDVTLETSGVVVWDQDAVDASGTVAPRMPTHDSAGAASLFAAGGEPVEDYFPIAKERVKMVVAGAGNTKTGTFEVWIG